MTQTLNPPLPKGSTSVPTVRIMGVDFAALDTAGVVARFVDGALEGHGRWIVTAHIEHLRRCVTDAEQHALIRSADLVVADGAPIVLASRIAGLPLPQRVTGSDMIWQIAERAALRGASIFFIGGPPLVSQRAAAVLQHYAEGLQVIGTLSPPFGFVDDPCQMDVIAAELRRAQPDIVLLALPGPMADRLTPALRELLPGASFMGIGVTLSFVTGDVKRAPTPLQHAGLEWLHRLHQEPTRLWRRYLLDGLPFAARLMTAAVATRVQSMAGGAWGRGSAEEMPRIGSAQL